MNHSEKLEQLRRGARIGERLILALLVLIGVLAALAVVAFFRYVLPGPLPPALEIPALGLTLGGTKLALAAAAVLFKCGIDVTVLILTRRMLRDVARTESPFSLIHVRRLRTMTALILVGSFVNLFSIQVGEWMLALVCWVLSLMFDYGCVLQQESDETL